jgi:hypothetical protein
MSSPDEALLSLNASLRDSPDPEAAIPIHENCRLSSRFQKESCMAFQDPMKPPARGAAHRKAMDQFAVPNRPSSEIQRELRLERAAVDANTAKLRALRLAKEASDREAATLAAANAPPPKAKKSRNKAVVG